MMLIEYKAIRVNGKAISQVRDTVCTEDVFRLYLNDQFLTELVASPEQLEELGAGFVVCEGLAEQVDAVSVSGNEIRACARTSGDIQWELRSCASVGLRRSPREVESSLTIEPQAVFRIRQAIESEAWRKTGGLHRSVLFVSHQLIIGSNDVGRHNTVDKVVGYALLNDLDLGACVLGCSGRQPAGMVTKAANAGIPIIVSKAAATDRGILTAEQAGVTLICFARDERFTVYTHPHRVRGIVTEAP
ncbi:MAG: formate dehydrogenase family accessory protein FdhD [Anaerolineae bacterium SM23_84]|nr:MAG: formate dehydrogenase family accessory protein FdhD [Anaerolineae bacterium SM23_84]